ncbi:GLPGLI family protein [Carboxylicivirga caseinilyticus]|uniref:GLPGLI family protein n=1 Tax=Carboxylicivirga caseinilyticus TaxID=3417572 RepID=UPI003D3275BD|nr:GLPGLI family protein [Marinilabiliaceae bacterium A049]
MQIKIAKLRIKILLLILVRYGVAIAQDDVEIDKVNYIASYLYTFQEDSLSNDRLKSEEMNLYIGSTYSKFEHAYAYQRDSIIKVYKNHTNQQEATQIAWSLIQQLPGGGHFTKFKILKENNNDTITFFESNITSKVNLKVIQNIQIDWNLVESNDTIICNYKCHKATCNFSGRYYKAWYTMELPFNNGPYKFLGLPGLIVKIEDKEGQHIFELTSFNKINYCMPIYFNKERYKTTDMRAYYRAKKTRAMELVQLINNSQTFGDVNTGEIEAKIMTLNNYIERL